MSIAAFALSDQCIAQSPIDEAAKKAPAKRTLTAKKDQRLTPEPR